MSADPPGQGSGAGRAHGRPVSPGVAGSLVLLLCLGISAPASAQGTRGSPGSPGLRAPSSARRLAARVSPRLALASAAARRAHPAGRAGRGPIRLVARDGGTSVPLLVGAGVLGGAVGVVAGALGGAVLGDAICHASGGDAGSEECFGPVLRGSFYGVAAVESTLLPLGVHLANGRRGPYGTSLLTSLAVGAAAVGGLHLSHFDPPWSTGIVIAAPALQIASSVLWERRDTPGTP